MNVQPPKYDAVNGDQAIAEATSQTMWKSGLIFRKFNLLGKQGAGRTCFPVAKWHLHALPLTTKGSFNSASANEESEFNNSLLINVTSCGARPSSVYHIEIERITGLRPVVPYKQPFLDLQDRRKMYMCKQANRKNVGMPGYIYV